jgi:hypothetical protein
VTRRRKRRPKDAGCYVFRTRKPGAFWGWPVVGRHTAYIGEGYNRALRETEHRTGSTRFRAMPKNWIDLDPHFYRIPTPLAHVRWVRKAQESLWIWLLCPVYNIRKQPAWNARKISGRSAQWQRYLRDNLGLWYKIPRAVFRWSVLGVIAYLSVWITPGGPW